MEGSPPIQEQVQLYTAQSSALGLFANECSGFGGHNGSGNMASLLATSEAQKQFIATLQQCVSHMREDITEKTFDALQTSEIVVVDVVQQIVDHSSVDAQQPDDGSKQGKKSREAVAKELRSDDVQALKREAIHLLRRLVPGRAREDRERG
ncbi:Uu.00g066410.m01.CDS01 [Anthostomella pinea]|uniref:Uu.00g066410.m01.CDS01 n=1 Tax=Anthostomella pinea TaxID=933095 RepID=A0AAI8YNE2_9PEZI|nr:Uu.00g066410.m01.CDS01 [Anthostomella pinea]